MTSSDNNHNNEGMKPIRAPKRKGEGQPKPVKHKRIKQKELHKVDAHPWWIAIPHFSVNSTIYVFITILCCIGLFWVKLQHGPLNLDFAKDKIEQALSNTEAGYAVTLEEAELIWAEFDKPLFIRVKDVVFNHQDGTELYVETAVVGLSSLNLLRGKVRPTYIQITGPTIQLVEQNGQISLFWKDEADLENVTEETSLPPKERNVRKDVQGFLTALFDQKLEGVYKNLQTLNRISLNNIVVFLKQEAKPNALLGSFDLNLDKSQDALSGDLTIDLPKISDTPSKITSLISYRAQEKDMTFAANLYGLQAEYLKPFLDKDNLIFKQQAIVQGEIRARLNDQLQLAQVQTNISVSDGRFVFPDITPETIEVQEVALKANLDRAENKVAIEGVTGRIENIPFEMTATGTFSKEKMTAPFTLSIAEGSIDTIKPFIPDVENPSTLQIWLKDKLSGGTFKDIQVSGQYVVNRDLETGERKRNIEDIKASFNFEDMTIQYSSLLAAATNASGQGSYADRNLNIIADAARIGDLVSDSVVVDILNIGQGDAAKGDVKIKASGPISGLFKYLSGEPINFDKKSPFKASETKGDVTANIQVEFPLQSELNRKDFIITADGVVKNAMLPNVVKGLPLTSPEMEVTLKDNIVSVKGKGQLAQRPVDVTYQQNIGAGGEFKNKVVASITADEGLRKAFGIELSPYVSGAVPINFNYVDQGDLTKVNVSGVLGPVQLSVPMLDYSKSAGVPGTVSFQAVLQNNKLIELNQVKAETEGLHINEGRILFAANGNKVKMSRGSMPTVQFGKTNASVEFETIANNVLKLIIKGPTVDASAFFKEKKEELESNQGTKDTQPKQISIVADQMILKDGNTAKNVKAYFEVNKIGKVSRAEMDALIGNSQTVLRFKPDPNTGLRNLFLEASDAGDFFRGLGLYKNIQGGQLKIYGQPLKANSDDIIGDARIDNFKARNAPILAKLVNALSLPGLVGLINNEGVTFSRLESKFEWQFRPQGDLIVLKDGRTSGTSLGLTFEGIVDRSSKTMDISGTAIPASELNKMIGNIPIVGQILTGGDALLAATYTVKGPSGDPNVVVNPLSVLAPGILRKILFEESVDSKVKKAE